MPARSNASRQASTCWYTLSINVPSRSNKIAGLTEREVDSFCFISPPQGRNRCGWSTVSRPALRAKLLGIEQVRVQFSIRLNIGILLSEHHLSLVPNLDPSCDPTARQATVILEANVVGLGGIGSSGLEQAHEQQSFLVHPELRRFQIPLLRADHEYRASFPSLLVEL